jgi:Sigma-70, region 4
MSRLDDLPPDQRAVLLLLVRQGKSHAEIAEMLGIPQDAVRDRARAALDALAGEPSASPAGARKPTRGGRQEAAAGGAREGGSPPSPASPSQPPAPSARAATRDTDFPGSLPSSRRGGALLLTALVVIVVVVVIAITSSGGGSNKATTSQAGTTTPAATTPSTTKTSGASNTSSTSSTAKGATPTVDNQIALTSPEANSKTVGLVEVVSEGSKHAIYLAAEHLPQPPAGSFYAVWLSNSPTNSTPLGKTPAVGSNGRLQVGTLLPANAGSYQKILLTRETSSRAAQPGPTILSGAFSLTH